MRHRNGGSDSRHRLSNMDSQVVLSIHVHLFFEKVEKSMECSVCSAGTARSNIAVEFC